MGARAESGEVKKKAAVITNVEEISYKRLRRMFLLGASRISPGFPLKTCGNDGLRSSVGKSTEEN